MLCHFAGICTLVWESPPSLRLHSPKDGDCHESSAHWLAMTRIRDRILKNVSFRTSSQTGVGIPAVQQTAFQFSCHSEPVRRLVWESPPSLRPLSSIDGDCHASVRYFIAMTGNSMVRRWSDALPPALVRGVVPVCRLVPGGA